MSFTMRDSKKYLSSISICRIIQSCRACGVSELKFGDLHVTFGKPAETAPMAFFGPVDSGPTKPSDTEISAIQEKVSQEALVQDEAREKHERLAQMLIEDPAQFEQLLQSGRLDEEADVAERDG